jgi:ABC-type transport system substrate-binding protein
MTPRRSILGSAAIALVAMLFTLAACGSSSSGPSGGGAGGKPVKGGTMVTSYQGEPQYLDPAIDWEGNGWSLEHTLFNGLLTYASGTGTEGTKLVPDIATAMPEITNGGLTYTFHIHPGIKFAPPVNREVTAADFKYSFERMMSAKTRPIPPGAQFYFSIVGAQEFNSGKATSVAGYKAVDKYTIEIDLKSPDATLLYALALPFANVVPQEWVQKYGTQFTHHPLGTGPYMLDHWTSGQEILLVRNPNFKDWRGHPDAWVDSIDVKLSVSPSIALLRLKSGQNDVLGDYIASSDYHSVKIDPVWGKQMAENPAIAIDYLFMNVTIKPFDNLKVRQAVSWAINRDKLLKLIGGAGTPLGQIYPVGMPGHVDGAAGDFYGYDPAKAKQLLADAGFANGFSVTIYSHNVDPWPKVIQSIQNDLTQIGIKASVRVLDRATYWTLIGTPGKVAMGMQDWWQDFPDPYDFIVPLFSKSNAVEGGANPSFWWDPKIEKMLTASAGVSDMTQRIATFDEMQKYIMDQAPAVPLYSPNVNSVFSKRLHGWYLHPVWIFDYLDYWIQ